MASEIAWVARYSCGHTDGSTPPPMREVDGPEDSVVEAARRKGEEYARAFGGRTPAREAEPPEPGPYRYPPDPDAEVWCDFCGQPRWVVDIIFARDQPLPRLAERRAGTRW